MISINKYRDLTLIDLNKNQLLVVATDSAGGLGEKSYDTVKIDPEIPAYYTAIGPIMEVLAFGATPITFINNLCVEMNPTGKKIINGMKRALKELGVSEENFITGSTEENFPVETTGMGVTVLGIIDKESWKKPRTTEGLIAAVVGIPKFGEDLKNDKKKTTMDIKRMKGLKELDYIKEILPVGSKGILYELEEISRTNDLEYKLYDDIKLDLLKSAGPSTCAIISIEKNNLDKLRKSIDIPVNVIGEFRKGEVK